MSEADEVLGSARLVAPLPAHQLDEARLAAFLDGALPGFAGPLLVRQFPKAGSPNPTYHLQTPNGAYVLRKKPSGILLPSAHAVEREFRVQAALARSAVPVPAMHDDVARVMAAHHGVDWRAAGLEGFGRTDSYIARQIDRWSRQYRASGMSNVPEMERLMDWLPGRLPADETAIAHGDYRVGNLVFHPTGPRVVAVLDCELSTLGHPLADLAHACIPWRLPPKLGGLAGVDNPGLPSEGEFVTAYWRRDNRSGAPELEYFLVFALFRWAAIAAGVYRRALDGNAADAGTLATGAQFRAVAAVAADLASKM